MDKDALLIAAATILSQFGTKPLPSSAEIDSAVQLATRLAKAIERQERHPEKSPSVSVDVIG
jgi:hypothetical protein